jgi:hypothetical protein
MSTNRGGMLCSGAVVLLKAHRSIVADQDLLSRYGEDLARAESYIYRRCLIQGVDARTLYHLEGALRQLRRRGCGYHSMRRRLLTDLLGPRLAEHAGLAFLRWTNRAAYDYYQSGAP